MTQTNHLKNTVMMKHCKCMELWTLKNDLGLKKGKLSRVGLKPTTSRFMPALYRLSELVYVGGLPILSVSLFRGTTRSSFYKRPQDLYTRHTYQVCTIGKYLLAQSSFYKTRKLNKEERCGINLHMTRNNNRVGIISRLIDNV